MAQEYVFEIAGDVPAQYGCCLLVAGVSVWGGYPLFQHCGVLAVPEHFGVVVCLDYQVATLAYVCQHLGLKTAYVGDEAYIGSWGCDEIAQIVYGVVGYMECCYLKASYYEFFSACHVASLGEWNFLVQPWILLYGVVHAAVCINRYAFEQGKLSCGA